MARIKIVHNSDVRIVSDTVLKAQNPYTALVEYVRAIFRIPAQLEPAQLVLAYSDDEGDIVTISSALELREAIRIAHQEHRRSLKLFLSTAGPEAAYLAARASELSDAAPSEVFSDLQIGSASQASGHSGQNAQNAPVSPRSDGENSFVYVDEGSPAAPAAPEGQPQPETAETADPTVSDAKTELDEPDWTNFPTPDQLNEWFKTFMEDSAIQAQLPTAVTVAYDALLTGESTLDQALNLAFDACPAIAEHPLVAQTRFYLPWTVRGVRQWVSTLVPLGEPMLQILTPQILRLLPPMFEGQRPDLELDITDAFYQVRDQEKHKKKQQTQQARKARKAEKRKARVAAAVAAKAAAAARADELSGDDNDDDDDNEIHITVRVPKWLRQLMTQAAARPCGRGGRGRRAAAAGGVGGGGCPFDPSMFANLGGLAGLFGQMMQGAGAASPFAPPQQQQQHQQAESEAVEPEEPEATNPPSQQPPSAPQDPLFDTTPLYDARLDSQDAILPGTPLPPGAVILKRWSLTNTGLTHWPEGTRLIRRNIDRGFTMDHEFEVPAAAPGETVDIVALVSVPHEEHKRFRASYRLRTPFPEGEFLGPQLFVDFVVDSNAVVPEAKPPTTNEENKSAESPRAKAAEEAAAAFDAMFQAEQDAARLQAEAARVQAEQEAARVQAEAEAARVKAEAEAARVKAQQEAEAAAQAIAEAARLKAEQEAAAAAAQAAAEAARVKAEQEEAAAAAAAAAAVPQAPPVSPWDPQLTGLAAMGFNDRETNIFLLQKHHGDMHRVVSELVQGS